MFSCTIVSNSVPGFCDVLEANTIFAEIWVQIKDALPTSTDCSTAL